MKSHVLEFPFKPIVTNELKEFIKKCLTQNPKDRYDIE